MRGGRTRTVTADSVTESAWRRNLSSSTEYYCAAAVAFTLLDLPATDYCHEFAGESESVAGAADSGGVEGGSPPLAGVGVGARAGIFASRHWRDLNLKMRRFLLAAAPADRLGASGT